MLQGKKRIKSTWEKNCTRNQKRAGKAQVAVRPAPYETKCLDKIKKLKEKKQQEGGTSSTGLGKSWQHPRPRDCLLGL
ncbi:hypothetical protein PsorP6_013999 [Peronosclerospora sorghi]|uniref:Uncharacterized protein n=1 Tax=Peronosclerospora sorghi TaxID=230839 RepID=A0ACC0VGK0_9STRA|nr:hypothetical protein PsorP6_013999 [Peronosclerospora sorghi]